MKIGFAELPYPQNEMVPTVLRTGVMIYAVSVGGTVSFNSLIAYGAEWFDVLCRYDLKSVHTPELVV